ncbi:hypothetical protein [Saccharolobus shibatae]|uniref:Uncharacterized protein n=1 Tax=Saccharolobus shibatae TaxID=2286 RepID=A0A8F5GZQ8_9CREN|nr:hypothetical protein [Saccharolobus shibatae]QXJ35356.1 hypothetical protein J5U22_01903 [Saccharolobus shibatae]
MRPRGTIVLQGGEEVRKCDEKYFRKDLKRFENLRNVRLRQNTTIVETFLWNLHNLSIIRKGGVVVEGI